MQATIGFQGRFGAVRMAEGIVQAQVFDWKDMERRTIIPGFHGKFVHSAAMTFALWDLDAGALLPEHSHPHEQVLHVFEGEIELTVDGETRILGPGMIGVVPPNAVHSGRVLKQCRVMDAFCPVREDYKTGGQAGILQAASTPSGR